MITLIVIVTRCLVEVPPHLCCCLVALVLASHQPTSHRKFLVPCMPDAQFQILTEFLVFTSKPAKLFSQDMRLMLSKLHGPKKWRRIHLFRSQELKVGLFRLHRSFFFFLFLYFLWDKDKVVAPGALCWFPVPLLRHLEKQGQPQNRLMPDAVTPMHCVNTNNSW